MGGYGGVYGCENSGVSRSSIILLFGLHLTYEQYYDIKLLNCNVFWNLSQFHFHSCDVSTDRVRSFPCCQILARGDWMFGRPTSMLYIQRYVFAQRYILCGKISGPLSPTHYSPGSDVTFRWKRGIECGISFRNLWKFEDNFVVWCLVSQ